jgi:hypothetical protein
MTINRKLNINASDKEILFNHLSADDALQFAKHPVDHFLTINPEKTSSDILGDRITKIKAYKDTAVSNMFENIESTFDNLLSANNNKIDYKRLLSNTSNSIITDVNDIYNSYNHNMLKLQEVSLKSNFMKIVNGNFKSNHFGKVIKTFFGTSYSLSRRRISESNSEYLLVDDKSISLDTLSKYLLIDIPGDEISILDTSSIYVQLHMNALRSLSTIFSGCFFRDYHSLHDDNTQFLNPTIELYKHISPLSENKNFNIYKYIGSSSLELADNGFLTNSTKEDNKYLTTSNNNTLPTLTTLTLTTNASIGNNYAQAFGVSGTFLTKEIDDEALKGQFFIANSSRDKINSHFNNIRNYIFSENEYNYLYDKNSSRFVFNRAEPWIVFRHNEYCDELNKIFQGKFFDVDTSNIEMYEESEYNYIYDSILNKSSGDRSNKKCYITNRINFMSGQNFEMKIRNNNSSSTMDSADEPLTFFDYKTIVNYNYHGDAIPSINYFSNNKFPTSAFYYYKDKSFMSYDKDKSGYAINNALKLDENFNHSDILAKKVQIDSFVKNIKLKMLKNRGVDLSAYSELLENIKNVHYIVASSIISYGRENVEKLYAVDKESIIYNSLFSDSGDLQDRPSAANDGSLRSQIQRGQRSLSRAVDRAVEILASSSGHVQSNFDIEYSSVVNGVHFNSYTDNAHGKKYEDHKKMHHDLIENYYSGIHLKSSYHFLLSLLAGIDNESKTNNSIENYDKLLISQALYYNYYDSHRDLDYASDAKESICRRLIKNAIKLSGNINSSIRNKVSKEFSYEPDKHIDELDISNSTPALLSDHWRKVIDEDSSLAVRPTVNPGGPGSRGQWRNNPETWDYTEVIALKERFQKYAPALYADLKSSTYVDKTLSDKPSLEKIRKTIFGIPNINTLSRRVKYDKIDCLDMQKKYTLTSAPRCHIQAELLSCIIPNIIYKRSISIDAKSKFRDKVKPRLRVSHYDAKYFTNSEKAETILASDGVLGEYNGSYFIDQSSETALEKFIGNLYPSENSGIKKIKVYLNIEKSNSSVSKSSVSPVDQGVLLEDFFDEACQTNNCFTNRVCNILLESIALIDKDFESGEKLFENEDDIDEYIKNNDVLITIANELLEIASQNYMFYVDRITRQNIIDIFNYDFELNRDIVREDASDYDYSETNSVILKENGIVSSFSQASDKLADIKKNNKASTSLPSLTTYLVNNDLSRLLVMFNDEEKLKNVINSSDVLQSSHGLGTFYGEFVRKNYYILKSLAMSDMYQAVNFDLISFYHNFKDDVTNKFSFDSFSNTDTRLFTDSVYRNVFLGHPFEKNIAALKTKIMTEKYNNLFAIHSAINSGANVTNLFSQEKDMLLKKHRVEVNEANSLSQSNLLSFAIKLSDIKAYNNTSLFKIKVKIIDHSNLNLEFVPIIKYFTPMITSWPCDDGNEFVVFDNSKSLKDVASVTRGVNGLKGNELLTNNIRSKFINLSHEDSEYASVEFLNEIIDCHQKSNTIKKLINLLHGADLDLRFKNANFSDSDIVSNLSNKEFYNVFSFNKDTESLVTKLDNAELQKTKNSKWTFYRQFNDVVNENSNIDSISAYVNSNEIYDVYNVNIDTSNLYVMTEAPTYDIYSEPGIDRIKFLLEGYTSSDIERMKKYNSYNTSPDSYSIVVETEVV